MSSIPIFFTKKNNHFLSRRSRIGKVEKPDIAMSPSRRSALRASGMIFQATYPTNQAKKSESRNFQNMNASPFDIL